MRQELLRPNEIIQPLDRPTVFINGLLGDEKALKLLITKKEENAPLKQMLIINYRTYLNSFTPKEKLSFFEASLDVLSDSDAAADQRDGILEVLKLADFTQTNQQKLAEFYLLSIDDLNKNADPFGEIDALLEAGKIMAPTIGNAKTTVIKTWNNVAKNFQGEEKAHILDKKNQISQQIVLSNLSDFDKNVWKLMDENYTNPEIAERLNVPIQKVKNSVYALRKAGEIKPRKGGRRPQNYAVRITPQVKELRTKGFTYEQMAKALEVPPITIWQSVRILVEKGEIEPLKPGRPKKQARTT